MSTLTETIYALRRADKILYVGRSLTPELRARTHRNNGVPFDNVVTLAVVPQSVSCDVETAAIRILRPPLNKLRSGNGNHGTGRSSEGPLQIRLSNLRGRFDKRVKFSGLGHGELIRMAVYELLERYKTPEATIEGMIAYRTREAAKNAGHEPSE